MAKIHNYHTNLLKHWIGPLSVHWPLHNPKFNQPFIILSQTFDGEEHPILYISQKLTPVKQRYAAMEREALAINWAITELQYYLTG